VSAVGLGVNEWQVCETVARNADVDLFLVAGRYTLLEQEPLDSFLPLCERQKMGVIVGSPFNSGILATGPTPGARFDYVAAPAGVMEKARRIEAVCRAHGVGLRDAAIQFPLHHPAVVSVLFGAITPQEVDDDLASVRRPIPDALWQDLVHQGLLREDAPTGRSGPAAGPGQGFARS